MVTSNDPNDWQNLKYARDNCNNMIEKAKKDYHDCFFEANLGNSKVVWKSINKLMFRNSKSGCIPFLKSDNHEVSNDVDIAENFNKRFSEIGSKLTSIESHTTKSFSDYLKTTTTVFTLNRTTPNVVFKLLSLIPDRKATGLDPILSNLLKHVTPVISESPI